jgi:hypothetical protein
MHWNAFANTFAIRAATLRRVARLLSARCLALLDALHMKPLVPSVATIASSVRAPGADWLDQNNSTILELYVVFVNFNEETLSLSLLFT